MIVVIDNYDSFTYNLVQYLGELGAQMQVFRNDQTTLQEIEALEPTHIVISPGPGDPLDGGISNDVIRHFAPRVPVLGVCLGHQCIGYVFGGRIIRAGRIMHGKTSMIHHQGHPIFQGVPDPFEATRYHSLVVEEPLPEALMPIARTPEGELMGLCHQRYPVIGLQFHPESILTTEGKRILRNFLEMGSRTRSPGGWAEAPRELAEGVADVEGRRSSEVPTDAVYPPDAVHPPDAVCPPATREGESMSELEIRGAVGRVVAGQDLSEAQAEAVMGQIMAGEATPAQIGAFLAALRMKGETVEEITGCARAMRRSAIPVRPRRQDLVDTCGTGGDETGTFNISTTTAFVVAGAGLGVAKHGNRSVSSRCGSADLLEALGVNLELSPEQVAQCIDEVGIGFLFAPRLHPAMKYAIGPRREMGVRTIFNILGPLTNPALAQRQLMGVYDPGLTNVLAQVLGGLGAQAALVVHGADGLDELSTTGMNRLSYLQEGMDGEAAAVKDFHLDPAELGLPRARLEDLRGGTAEENVEITRAVLSGEEGAHRDVVLLNTAAALLVGGRAEDLKEGLELAAEAIDSGAALGKVEALVALSQELGATG
jgi:anthranilate synthase/phosphoribosyltransferase